MDQSYAVIRVSMVTGAPGLVKVLDNQKDPDRAVEYAARCASTDYPGLYKFEVIALTKRDKRVP